MAKDKTNGKPGAGEVIDNSTGEVVNQLPATIDGFSGGQLAGHKLVKRVSVAVLPWTEGASITFSPQTKIVVGKVIDEKAKGDDGEAKKPASIMQIMSAAGAVRLLVVGKMIEGELKENYPGDSYVGKWFFATKFAPNKARGKRYATYEISEIEDPR